MTTKIKLCLSVLCFASITLCAQENPRVKWVFKKEFNTGFSSGELFDDNDPYGRRYFADEDEGYIFNIATSELKHIKIGLISKIELGNYEYLFTANCPGGECITDLDGKIIKKTKYKDIKHIGEDAFVGKKESDPQNLYFFRLKSNKKEIKIKTFDQKSDLNYSGGFIMEENFNLRKIRIYNENGELLLEREGVFLNKFNTDIPLFSIADNPLSPDYLINAKGETVYRIPDQWSRDDLKGFLPGIGKYIRFTSSKKNWYTDLTGNKVEEVLYLNFIGDSIQTIENCKGKYNYGLYFKNSNTTVECRYMDLLYDRPHKIIICERSDFYGPREFYDLHGNLFFKDEDRTRSYYLGGDNFATYSDGVYTINNLKTGKIISLDQYKYPKIAPFPCFYADGVLQKYFIFFDPKNRALLFDEHGTKTFTFEGMNLISKAEWSGKYLILFTEAGKAGLFTTDGKTIIPPDIYENIRFNEFEKEPKFLIVKKDNIESLIDINTQEVILSGFSHIYFFNRDYIAVVTNLQDKVFGLARIN